MSHPIFDCRPNRPHPPPPSPPASVAALTSPPAASARSQTARTYSSVKPGRRHRRRLLPDHRRCRSLPELPIEDFAADSVASSSRSSCPPPCFPCPPEPRPRKRGSRGAAAGGFQGLHGIDVDLGDMSYPIYIGPSLLSFYVGTPNKQGFR
jgi:hypothetical protein